VDIVQHIVVIGVALAVTWGLTPLVRLAGTRLGIVAHPGGRNVHKGSIPRIGGVAMFGGFAAAIGARYLGEVWLHWPAVLTNASPRIWGVFAGMTVMFLVGIVDDVIDLKPGQKLLGQVAAAAVVLVGGVGIAFMGNPLGGGLILLGVLSVPITLLWIVGFANVINLIDGLDGLAAGISAIAAVTLLVLAEQSNQLVSATIAAALVGACLGFLRFNFHPASIFMGDSGSLFLGSVLAIISLLGVMKSVAAITLVVPLLIIGVPLFDTLSAIIRRRRGGRPIQEADKGHIHHRLLSRGFDQRQTVLIIYAWSIALAVGGYAVRWVPAVMRAATFVILAVMSGFMAHWLGLFETVHRDGDT